MGVRVGSGQPSKRGVQYRGVVWAAEEDFQLGDTVVGQALALFPSGRQGHGKNDPIYF